MVSGSDENHGKCRLHRQGTDVSGLLFAAGWLIHD